MVFPVSDLSGDGPIGAYANYFEIGFNALEFVLLFAQRYGQGEPRVHTRIVTGPVYAKALHTTLGDALASFERAYGPITDEPGGGADVSDELSE